MRRLLHLLHPGLCLDQRPLVGLLQLLLGLGLAEGGGWRDLGDLSWRPAFNRGDLERSLEDGVGLVSVKVDNGTQFLHLGGDLNEFLPIVVNPREVTSSSDLTLEEAVNLVADQGSRTALHISFLTPTVLEASLDVLKSRLEAKSNLTVLVEAAVLAADPRAQQPLIKPRQFIRRVKEIPGVVPLLGWSTFHGMDKLWRRVEQDGILIHFQLVRVKQIIEDLYLRPRQIKNTDVMYLEQLQRRLAKQQHESSLTVLAISQIMAALVKNGHPGVSKDPTKPRRPYQPPRANPIRQILPDYYVSSGAYTDDTVDEMLQLAGGLDRVGFALRAGVAANSVEQVARLVDDDDTAAGRFLVVSAEATDKEGRRAVEPLLRRVGRPRVVLALGPDTTPPASEESGRPAIRIPQPKEPRDGSGAAGHLGPGLISSIILFYSSLRIL